MPRLGAISVTNDVKLRSEHDWVVWYSRLRDVSINREVWDMINPNVEERTPIPPRPKAPVFGDDVSSERMNALCNVYKHQKDDYDEVTLSLAQISEWVAATIPSEVSYALEQKERLPDRLIYLRDRFSRNAVNKHKYRIQWYRWANYPPGRGEDIEEWLAKWELLRDRVEMTGFKIYPSQDFMIATTNLPLQAWWSKWNEKIIVNEEDVDSKTLVTSFRNEWTQHYGSKQPGIVVEPPRTAFSTLQGFEEASPDTQKAPYDERPCPCGRQGHKAWLCYTMNEKVRPSGWRLSRRGRQSAINEALKDDEGFRTWIENKIREHNARSKSPQSTSCGNHSSRKDCEKLPSSSPPINANRDARWAMATAFNVIPNLRSLRDEWILDTGASSHVCNDKRDFVTLSEATSTLRTGDTVSAVKGYGDAYMAVVCPTTGRKELVRLRNVAYAPGFHVNLVSYSLAKDANFKWNEDENYLQDSDGTPIAVINHCPTTRLWIFKKPKPGLSRPQPIAMATRRSALPNVSTASLEMWHRRMGHISPRTVRKAAELVRGVSIDTQETASEGKFKTRCPTCNLSQAPRQISRRPIDNPYGKYGMAYFDVILFEIALNGDRYATHFYIPDIRFHWIMTHPDKRGVRDAIKHFVKVVPQWFNVRLRALHTDNETTITEETRQWIAEQGLVFTTSVPHSAEMNGPAERSGGVIIMMMRKMCIESRLPTKLWPWLATSAVWLLNRLPTYLKDQKRWLVPLQEVRDQFGSKAKEVDLSCLKVLGSLTYCRIPDIPRMQKLVPRADVGYLVGFVASNVWQVWFPQNGRVVAVRDAVFDETLRYDPNRPFWKQHPLPIPEGELLSLNEELAYHAREIGSEEARVTQRYGLREGYFDTPVPADSIREVRLDTSPPTQREEQREEESRVEAQEEMPGAFPGSNTSDIRKTPPVVSLDSHSFPTPRSNPRSPNLEPDHHDTTDDSLQLHRELSKEFPSIPSSPENYVERTVEPEGVGSEESHPEEQTPQSQTRTHRPRDEGIDSSNIISGTRRRRQNKERDFAYTALHVVEDNEPAPLLHAFATALNAEKPRRQHSDDLPPEPDGWHELRHHPHKECFLAAAAAEVKNLTNKATFEEVLKPNDRSKQVLPLRWVFKYKFDADGYLIKHKARICVRGDLERISAEEKRAATLAARTARMIFALVAAFDLDLHQMDAVAAFLNSHLPAPVYTVMPQGFEKAGKVWKLEKALYGLRISPKLWQQEASAVLTKIGLTQVPEDPCVFVGHGIIVFFYVDDILIASHPSVKDEAANIERQLHQHWELTDHGDAHWFLGIRIIRNREEKKLWLCQDTYIATMAAKYNLTDRPPISTPFPAEDLLPYSGNARPQDIDIFARKIGSAQYATTITRTDAAKATAKLAQFMTNPGPQHLQAIDRVIVYLYHTRFLAIQYGHGSCHKSIEFSSDASFGDNVGRKSSAGYICQMYGGPIDWKASKQSTVTTSTTEAELLALSDAARSLYYWERLLGRIQFEASHPITIQCDNSQTVELICNPEGKLHTKLRHVDIHSHWLRQEVKRGHVKIEWVPTTTIVADGLTKALPRQKHEHFVKLLGMVDVGALIDE